MTNEELIELVQSHTPAELKLEEIELLRQRIAESAELRRVLIDQLQMEHYLNDALGRIGFSAESLLDKFDRDQRRRRTVRAIGGLLALIVFASAAGTIYYLQPKKEVAEATIDPDPSNLSEKISAEQTASPTRSGEVPEQNGTSADPTMPSNRGNEEQGGEADQPAKQGPWDTSLARPPVRFADAWFHDFDPAREAPTQDSLSQWFTPLQKQGGRFETQKHHNTVRTGMFGSFRLNAPWPRDAALRLSVWDAEQYAIHFLNGDEGISIVRHNRDYDPWNAYAVSRKSGEEEIQRHSIIASDGFADRRSDLFEAPITWYYYDETQHEMVLLRGEIEMLRAPLANPPTEVVFEGKAWLRGLDFQRLSELPPSSRLELPIVAELDRPADLPWTERLPMEGGVTFNKLDDGAVELVGVKGDGLVTTPIPGEGIRVVDMLLDEFEVGGSVLLAFLANPGEETPRYDPGVAIPFGRNNVTKQVFPFFSWWGDDGRQDNRRPQELPTTDIVAPIWIRILACDGQARFWTSADGRNWALYPSGVGGINRPQTEFGISIKSGGGQPRKIRLRKVVVRHVDLLPDVVSAERLAATPTEVKHSIDWITKTIAARPSDVPLEQWMAAAAEKSINAGSDNPNVLRQLVPLLNDPASLETTLDRLRKFAYITKSWPPGQNEREWFDFYRDFAADLIGREYADGREFDVDDMRRTMLSLPIDMRDRVNLVDEGAIRDAMLQKLAERDWNGAIDLCLRQRNYSGRDEYRMRRDFQLPMWVYNAAIREANARVEGEWPSIDARYRSPLLEELSKDAYNVSADLSAAIDSNAMADACRIINSVNLHGANGLAPDREDPDLYFSLPAAITMAMRRNPQLREEMNRNFSEVARLRASSEIHSGDVEAVELVTLQFFGTQAASEAHLWLGDQALAVGQVARAIAHYRQAGGEQSTIDEQMLNARLALAAAMIGAPESAELSTSVAIGGESLSPDAIKQFGEQRRSIGSDNWSAARQMSIDSSQLDFPPTNPKVGDAVRLQLDFGEGANDRDNLYASKDVDWTAETLAATMADDRIYLNNRFQLLELKPDSGEIAWKTARIDSHRARAHDKWPLTPMRPVVVGDRIFVRLLHSNRPELYCFNRADGKKIWRAESELPVLSDPLWIQGELFAIVGEEDSQNLWQIQLARIDAETGETLSKHSLVRLRQSWGERRLCAASVAGDLIVVDLGGAVLACDLSGGVRWVRKQTSTPTSADSDLVRQQEMAPIVVDNRVIVRQVGALSIDCIDIATGRLLWSHFAPNMERSVGLADGKFVYLNRGEAVALHAEDGEVAWKHDDDWQVYSAAIAGSYLIEVAGGGRRLGNDREITPWIRWLSLETGRPIAGVPLAKLTDKDPQLGKLLIHPQGTYVSHRKEARDLDLRLHRLEAASDPLKLGDYQPVAGAKPIFPTFAAAWGGSFPGWRFATAETTSGQLIIEQDGKPEFELNLHPTNETTLIHPAEAGKQVTLAVDRRGARGAIRAQVRCGDQMLLEGPMTDEGDQAKFSVNLPPNHQAGDLVEISLTGGGKILVRNLTIQ
ncbi:PQQ-like beta-propeller repeat protein [Blastopirellula sp. JC732]|uniref:PQQ-like beta-propeller repeat protein n=1 Tax=Blastopirellula sediminis TaxID=2894196 RepID=A0A9X1SFF7_9BACT|nr:PQQ-binding-like beta-propeller repeat protein [Blastopirellula sediminis]MCC9609522.1 PQQ-like beta-propeller repeat protein [Blastopirellula sediminis]MCC9627702.1 PQQ-like beta-propeller repeat protein [Blastopirellula sediminis]